MTNGNEHRITTPSEHDGGSLLALTVRHRSRAALATALLTALALLAFAANSVICRAALESRAIDAAGFATIRLASGAALLALLHTGSGRRLAVAGGLVQPAMLFVYVTAFSFAYLGLGAGTGALILFAAVQSTMLLAALHAGERLRAPEGVGLALALAGLARLVAPGLAAPSLAGSALMAAAGVAWGVYSLRGRGAADALGETARNFVLATPPALLVSLLAFRGVHLSLRGVALAVASGAVTSGLGYMVWFAALRGLTAIRAAVVQLAVPALAAAGGAAFLAERVTLRLVLSAALILGGVGLAIAGRSRWIRERPGR